MMLLTNIQEKALNDLDHIWEAGTIHSTMRSGKTAVAIHYLVRNNLKCLWLAYGLDEKEIELEEEFRMWGYQDYFLKNVTVIHSRSISKFDMQFFDILIFNECHNITKTMVPYLKKANKLLGLTGTYPNAEDKKRLFIETGLDNILFEYLIHNAILDNVISDYKINLVFIPPNTENNIDVRKTSKDGKSLRFKTSEQQILNRYVLALSNIDLKILPLNTAKAVIQQEIDSYKPFHEENAENKSKLRFLYGQNSEINSDLKPLWNQKKNVSLYLMQEMNAFETRVQFAKKTIQKYSDKRVIIFAPNTEISLKISSNVYNSKSDSEYLSRFKKSEINNLVLVNKVSTGSTFNNISCVILLAPNSRNTNILQKLGRGLLNDKDTPLNVYIPYCHKIQLDWILKALVDLDPNKIEYLIN